MECLPENKVLKYNPDTLVSLRKLYNLDKPGQMDEAIDILDAWIKKQNHFVKKDFSREYLERVIIQIKGSVERSKAQMDKICTLRTLLPQYFEKCDARNDYKILEGYMSITLLPRLTEDNLRIVFSKYEAQRYSPQIFFHIFAKIVLICEYLKARDYFNGVNILVDFRGINIVEFVAQLNLTQMKEVCTIFLEGYDTRVKKFLFMSTSKTIEILINIFKQMISEKLRQRVYVLKTNEELQEHVPRELLPADYGGDEKPLSALSETLTDELVLSKNIAHFKEIMKAQTIEALRIPSQYNGDFSGLAGTFRSLNVD